VRAQLKRKVPVAVAGAHSDTHSTASSTSSLHCMHVLSRGSGFREKIYEAGSQSSNPYPALPGPVRVRAFVRASAVDPKCLLVCTCAGYQKRLGK
jgi:hypothetical protein